jgi:hypothetical protein
VAIGYGEGNLTVSTYLAEALLRQFNARSALLAPLGSTAETCWLIILHIYVAKDGRDLTPETLANDMKMPVEQINRYINLLIEVGFVRHQPFATNYRLGKIMHDAVDESLTVTAQNWLSSLGR